MLRESIPYLLVLACCAVLAILAARKANSRGPCEEVPPSLQERPWAPGLTPHKYTPPKVKRAATASEAEFAEAREKDGIHG